MTLRDWCEDNLHGGFLAVPAWLPSLELMRAPRRRHGQVIFTARHPGSGVVCHLIAQRFAARRANATGVRWRVGFRPAGPPEVRPMVASGGSRQRA